MAADWRDERITELETERARQGARIAELEGQLAQKDARIAELEGQVATLTAQVTVLAKQVADMMEKLKRSSRNSHLPPSSDPPGTRGAAGKGKDKQGTRKRGGQPGHGGSHRMLLPAQEVDEIVDFFPSHCEGCADELPEVNDPDAHRYQQVEVPPIKPHTPGAPREGGSDAADRIDAKYTDRAQDDSFCIDGPLPLAQILWHAGVVSLRGKRVAHGARKDEEGASLRRLDRPTLILGNAAR